MQRTLSVKHVGNLSELRTALRNLAHNELAQVPDEIVNVRDNEGKLISLCLTEEKLSDGSLVYDITIE